MYREKCSITFESKQEIAAGIALLQFFENIYNRAPESSVDAELVNHLLKLKEELEIMKNLYFNTKNGHQK